MIIKEFSYSKNPKRAIISLHGWTGNVSSMKPVSKSFNFPETKWIFPQAPYIVKNNSKNSDKFKNLNTYTWSKDSIRGKYSPKETSVIKSMIILTHCINNLEKEGFNKNKIFILGFSQGAIFSLWFIINQLFSIGGCISISGGFDKEKKFLMKNLKPESKHTRILLIHGEKDKIISQDESIKTYKIFKSAGFKTTLKLFPTTHKIPLKAKNIIWKFLIQE